MPVKSIGPMPTPLRRPASDEGEAGTYRPFRDGPLWWLTKDGDRSCRDLYRRHYSSRKSKRTSNLFIGPGEVIALRTAEADAVFVWRRFIDDSGQTGVSCAIFRNEGPHLSSILIRQADAIADHVWPGLRHYTFVDPSAVRSTNPGACFRHAGWTRCGATRKGLLIFERT
nr:MAG TPA: hypothetical protein [Caudoviricetes sp.]